MKTHMSNTKAKQLYTDIMAKTAFATHQQALHSQKIKPIVVTRRKQQIKITNNNKKQLNQNPRQHVNNLFKNIHQNNYKCSLDNQQPKCYQNGKKILKNKVKNNRYENQAKKEHQKQLESQMSRVKNCKSLAQRKKDNTDPIVKPTYFMRDNDKAEDVTIQNYKKTVMNRNRPQSAKKTTANYSSINDLAFTGQIPEQHEKGTSFGNVPSYSKQVQRPQSAKYPPNQSMLKTNNMSNDLPECNFKALLKHIVDNKLWKDTDMKVLYVRLCHRHGEEKVDEIWEMLMDQLER